MSFPRRRASIRKGILRLPGKDKGRDKASPQLSEVFKYKTRKSFVGGVSVSGFRLVRPSLVGLWFPFLLSLRLHPLLRCRRLRFCLAWHLL